MKRGFSLVELSIVLVILGLLTGGILAGQSLIKAAELRKVTTQLSAQRAAIYTFRDKYFALPGDMANAFSFWGTATGCLNALSTTAPYTGCNGNGDGLINDVADGGEDVRAVQFMALAGLIEGSYTGIGEATGNKRKVGINIIRAPYKNSALWLNSLSTAQFTFTGNNLLIAVEGASSPSGAVFTPEDQWNLDTKMDDGKASTGIITPFQGQASCFTGTDYILTATTQSCSLIYWLR